MYKGYFFESSFCYAIPIGQGGREDNLQYLFFYGGIADGKNGTDYNKN